MDAPTFWNGSLPVDRVDVMAQPFVRGHLVLANLASASSADTCESSARRQGTIDIIQGRPA